MRQKHCKLAKVMELLDTEDMEYLDTGGSDIDQICN